MDENEKLARPKFDLWHNQTIPILLIICFVALGFIRIQTFNDNICHFAQKSWQQRHDLVISLTAPSKLSDKLDPNDPQTKVLQDQIAHGNEVKTANRKHLLKVGGEQTSC